MSAGLRVRGKARFLVLETGSAQPYCVTSDSALSFPSLKVLPTSTPGPGELNSHHEGDQAVRGMQVMPPSAPSTLSLY